MFSVNLLDRIDWYAKTFNRRWCRNVKLLFNSEPELGNVLALTHVPTSC